MIVVKGEEAVTFWGDTTHDWVMYCDVHKEVMTASTWQDAYEAALGHACMQHSKVEICQRRGHDWRYGPWDGIEFRGYVSTPLVCTRCGEPGYDIAEAI